MAAPLKIPPGVLISLGWLVALCAMMAVYFGDFEQGRVVGGERLRNSLKSVALLLIGIAICRKTLRTHPVINFVTIVHVLCFVSTIVLIAITLDVPRDSQWLNFHVGVLALWVSYNWRRNTREGQNPFIFPLIVALLISLALDIWASIAGATLWENRAFIGTFGNPSTFGFMCGVGLIYTRQLSGFRRLIIGLVLCSGAIATQSLFAILTSITIFTMLNWRVGILLSPLLVVLAVQAVVLLEGMHFVFKLLSAGEFLRSGGGESASVTTRVEYIQSLIVLIIEHPWSLVLGHPDAIPYISGDAGWFSLIVSYGIPIVGLYAIIIFWVLKTSKSASHEELIARDVALLFLFFLLVNRIHDYWPIALIFYWHLGAMLAMKEIRRECLNACDRTNQEDSEITESFDHRCTAVSVGN